MRCANSRDFADHYGGIEHRFGLMRVLIIFSILLLMVSTGDPQPSAGRPDH
jgi:hypothetical protein